MPHSMIQISPTLIYVVLLSLNADLRFADFANADLSSVLLFVSRAGTEHFESADFSDAYLHSADLSRTTLSHANFRNVDLSFADLSFADLSFADLSNATLTDTNINGANFADAITTGLAGRPQ